MLKCGFSQTQLPFLLPTFFSIFTVMGCLDYVEWMHTTRYEPQKDKFVPSNTKVRVLKDGAFIKLGNLFNFYNGPVGLQRVNEA